MVVALVVTAAHLGGGCGVGGPGSHLSSAADRRCNLRRVTPSVLAQHRLNGDNINTHLKGCGDGGS